MLRSAPIGAKNLVASTTSSRRPCERLGDDLLRLARRVDVGGVDEVDAGVERGVDHRDRLVVVGVAPLTEHHRPEAQAADLHARPSERPVPHRGLPVSSCSGRYPIPRGGGRAGPETDPTTRGTRRAGDREGGQPILSLVGRGAGALRERVGHRVLAEQEVQDRRVLQLHRLDGGGGLDAGRVLHRRRSPRCTWPRRRSRGRARASPAPGTSLTLANALSTDFFTVRSTPLTAFLPAPVSTPFHAAAWSWCWLCAVWANVTTAAGTPVELALAVTASIAGLVGADGEVLERRRQRDDREVAAELLRRRGRGHRRPTCGSPLPRGRCRPRCRRARRHRAPRRHRAGTPGGSTASTPAA